ncbi:MAG: GIY-YIG nuclease family protein, partial [Candidatus Paceibacterota bacterium]
MKYYTVYKTTNLINDKIYIGIHETKNLNDNYLGSGKLLKRAIEKYGSQNFKREYLFIFDNKEEQLAKEKELVTEEF